MTHKEAVNWLINISADIGKGEHSDLWHYEQALDEMKEMLESERDIVPCKDCKYSDEYNQCDKMYVWNSADDYCSRGERR